MKFQTGESGNPNGRPKGTGHRQRLFNDFVSPHQEALIDTALKMALTGNESMLRLFLERMLPAKPTDDSIFISLPSGDLKQADSLLACGERILQAIAQGEITSEKGNSLMRLIEVQRKNIEMTDLSTRLDEIERTLKQRKKDK